MAEIDDLDALVKDYMSGNYTTVATKKIPSTEEVPFGKTLYTTQLTAFCIDLRKSTELLWRHDGETCCKIHKSFLTIATRVISRNGGQLRSFNGDSVLAFWPGQYKQDVDKAVKAAFQLKWALSTRLSKHFDKYTSLDFGIGIDWGKVSIVKAGLPRNDNNNDLVFLGTCVNYACEIASQAYGPNHVEVSTDVYSNLTDAWIYGTSTGVKQNMWKPGSLQWKGKTWSTKLTHWHASF